MFTCRLPLVHSEFLISYIQLIIFFFHDSFLFVIIDQEWRNSSNKHSLWCYNKWEYDHCKTYQPLLVNVGIWILGKGVIYLLKSRAYSTYHMVEIIYAINLVENDSHRNCKNVDVLGLEPFHTFGRKGDFVLQVLMGVWLGLNQGSSLTILGKEVLL